MVFLKFSKFIKYFLFILASLVAVSPLCFAQESDYARAQNKSHSTKKSLPTPKPIPRGRARNGAETGDAKKVDPKPTLPPVRNPQSPAALQPESFEPIGQIGSGYAYSLSTSPKPNPDVKQIPCDPKKQNKTCQLSQQGSLLFDAMLGARTKNAREYFLLAYYKYSLFWDVDQGRAMSAGNWFKSPANPNSPIPTRGLFRLHQLFADTRYINGAFRAGVQWQLFFGRENSSLFRQEGEEVLVTFRGESAVPYVLYVSGRYHRVRAYAPIYTVVNSVDIAQTYSTFSINRKGRGPVFSLGLNNAFYVPFADSILDSDVVYINYKFYSVTNDRTVLGGRLIWKYTPGFFEDLSAFCSVTYFQESYYIPRPIIPNYVENNETLEKAIKLNRVDTTLKYSIGGSYTFAHRHQLSGSYFIVDRKSKINEYVKYEYGFQVRYAWMFPSVKKVTTLTRASERNPLNGVFEGETD